ncbi:Survival motor neuron [Macrophomina phaseolina MS6]|uniref:Survival motor neuron n=1 Tax=Macrophomina phaseolina (strain MS6) TaxID=1126212 RepID=K2S8W3_MACPH|nr:Survival motor neuron [Macrophomina phaseolina MS6]
MSGVDMFAAGAWDDRALVKGWNDQVKEYNKYHSLQRKGKQTPLSLRLTAQEIFNLKDLANDEELAEMGINLSEAEHLAKPNEESKDAHMESDDTAHEAQQADSADILLTDAAPANGTSEETDPAERQLIQEQQQQQQQANQPRPGASSAASQAPPIPAPIFAAVPGQDDALRNMNIAWFYAGYYQSQYEAQQRAAYQSG